MATTKKTTKAKSTPIKAVSTTKESVIDAKADTGKTQETTNPNLIKKKDIYDHVSVATGLRKRDVREAVDSLLEYFHKCLEEGKTIQVPPLGKIKTIERGSDDNIKLHYKIVLKKSGDAEKKSD